MKDPDEMTLDECRGELAVARGYRLKYPGHNDIHLTPDAESTDDGVPHPIGTTLDAIAGAMPEGWRIQIVQRDDGTFGAEAYYIEWIKTCKDWTYDLKAWTRPKYAIGVDTTEILARARLAIACWRAKKAMEL